MYNEKNINFNLVRGNNNVGCYSKWRACMTITLLYRAQCVFSGGSIFLAAENLRETILFVVVRESLKKKL